MGNLISTLTFKVVDDATKPARSVGQALEDAGKKAKAVAKAMADTGATEKFTTSLAKLKVSAKDIEQVAKAWKQYASDAKLAANASDWTRTQAAGVKRWESQTIAALRAVEREQAAYARATKKAMATAHGSHYGVVGYTAQGAAAAVSAHSIFRVTEQGLEAGAERQHVKTGMLNAGMKPAEILRAEESARRASRGAPNLSVSEIMELHKEARSAVRHPEEAFELIDDLAKAGSILKGMGVSNQGLTDVVKAGESLGLLNDKTRFHKYLEGQIKAMAVLGRTITPEQVYEAAKYSKAAGATLSDRFLNLVMPSLIQDMHGSSAGDALSMLSKTLRGGLQHKHTPVERLKDLGMLEEPSKIRRSKTDQILGYGGKVVGDDLLSTDPDKFARIFNQHMEAHGYKTLAEKTKVLQETLPSTAANLLRILIQQQEAIEQHGRNYNEAPGLMQSVTNQKQDPVAGVINLKSALTDLGAAVTSPAMATVGATLSSIADGIRKLADAAKDHPAAAMTAGTVATAGGLAASGYLSYKALKFGSNAVKGVAKLAAAGAESAPPPTAGAVKIAAPAAAVGTVGKFAGLAKGAGFVGGLITIMDLLHKLDAWEDDRKKARDPAGYARRRSSREKLWRANEEALREMERRGLEPNGFKAGGKALWDWLFPPAHADVAPHGGLVGLRRDRGHATQTTPTAGADAAMANPYGSLSGVTDLKAKADEAKVSLDALNTTVSPTVAVAGADAAIAQLHQIMSLLQQISSTASGAMSAIRGMNVPQLGKLQRGNFSFGGVKGE